MIEKINIITVVREKEISTRKIHRIHSTIFYVMMVM
jgi:hypothetical protein